MFKFLTRLQIFNTVGRRIVFLIVISSVAYVFVLLFVQTNEVTTRLNEYNLREYTTDINTAVSDFEHSLGTAITNTQMAAPAIGSMYYIDSANIQSVVNHYFEQILKENSEYKAVWCILDPLPGNTNDSLLYNVYPGFPIGFYTYISINDITKGAELLNNIDNISTEVAEAYSGLKKSQGSVILGPLSDPNHSNKITVVSSIVYNNRFVGLLGVDIDKFSLLKKVDANKIGQGKFIILNSVGKIVLHENSGKIGKNFSDVYPFTNDKNRIQIRAQNGLEVSFSDYIKENDEDIRYFWYSRNLVVGKIVTPWIIGSYIPEEMVRTESRNLLIEKLIYAAIGLAIFLFVALFAAYQISKPIKATSKILEQIATGDLNVSIRSVFYRFSSVEMNAIANALNKLLRGLKLVSGFASNLQNGNYNAGFTKLSESDELGIALVALRDNMVKQQQTEEERTIISQQIQWATSGIAHFADILRDNVNKISTLGYEIIRELVPYVGANQGGIFIRNFNENVMLDNVSLVAAFAYNRDRFENKEVSFGDGLIGACAYEKRTIFLKKVPDNYADITSGLGEASPTSVLITPLVFSNTLYGVLELASFIPFEKYQIEFIERLSENIASAFASALINEQTTNLLKRTQEQSRQMVVKEQELTDRITQISALYANSQVTIEEFTAYSYAIDRTIMIAQFGLNAELLLSNRKFSSFFQIDKTDYKKKNIYDVLQLSLQQYDDFKSFFEDIKGGSTENYTIKVAFYGYIKYVKLIFTPILNADNKPARFLVAASEISDQKEMEFRLSELAINFETLTKDYQISQLRFKEKEENISVLTSELFTVRERLNEIQMKFEKVSNTAQFFKRELEKRIDKFRKIEVSLKEKLKAKEEEINKLKGM